MACGARTLPVIHVEYKFVVCLIISPNSWTLSLSSVLTSTLTTAWNQNPEARLSLTPIPPHITSTATPAPNKITNITGGIAWLWGHHVLECYFVWSSLLFSRLPTAHLEICSVLHHLTFRLWLKKESPHVDVTSYGLRSLWFFSLCHFLPHGPHNVIHACSIWVPNVVSYVPMKG